MKACSSCRKSLPLDDFHRRGNGHQAMCKKCKTLHKREWIRSNRERVKWNTIWTKYRIRREDFDRMLEQQDGRCAICKQTTEDWNIDHNHVTGEVRGLLCRDCNLFVGWFEKREHLFEQTCDYLGIGQVLMR